MWELVKCFAYSFIVSFVFIVIMYIGLEIISSLSSHSYP